jgi:hypothetical protein
MELTCLSGIDIGGMFGRHYQWVTAYVFPVRMRRIGLPIGFRRLSS